MISRLPRPRFGPTALLLVAAAALPRSAAAQVELCAEAERFVRDVGMEALTEPDTIDDWRTGMVTPGCRVTAAGASSEATQTVARGFFEVLEASEWQRTPDPRDSPNEASLRYRRFGADCLFNYYDRTLSLGTEAEFAVMDAVSLGPGDELYHVLVRCVPVAPAIPRGGGS
jgi:hypothetical protein